MWRQGVGDTSFVEKLEIQATRLYIRPDVAYALKLVFDSFSGITEARIQQNQHLRR